MLLKYRLQSTCAPRGYAEFNIELRHKVASRNPNNLSSQCVFFEIETPFMTRSTPEGRRDILSPRVQPGNRFTRLRKIAATV